MMPKFSIIIPVYNVAPYLRECLDSVLNQTCADWECVCVDDGSTDGSGAILDEYAAKEVEKLGGGGEARIKVIHQKNQGVSVARNAALDVASGEWIVFLDGDDWLDEAILERLATEIQSYVELDAIGYGVEMVIKGEASTSRFGAQCESRMVTGDDILGRIPRGIGKYAWAIWDKIFRREVIENNRIRFAIGMANHEDSLFAQTFLACAGKIKLCPDLLGYKYRMREGSASHHIIKKMPNDPLRTFRDIYAIWLNKRANGLSHLLVYKASLLIYLGKSHEFGRTMRGKAVEFLSNSSEFNKVVMPFLLKRGSFKVRLFAMFYLLLPKFMRKGILKAI